MKKFSVGVVVHVELILESESRERARATVNRLVTQDRVKTVLLPHLNHIEEVNTVDVSVNNEILELGGNNDK